MVHQRHLAVGPVEGHFDMLPQPPSLSRRLQAPSLSIASAPSQRSRLVRRALVRATLCRGGLRGYYRPCHDGIRVWHPRRPRGWGLERVTSGVCLGKLLYVVEGDRLSAACGNARTRFSVAATHMCGCRASNAISALCWKRISSADHATLSVRWLRRRPGGTCRLLPVCDSPVR